MAHSKDKPTYNVKKASMIPLLIRQLPSVCRIGKKIPIYKKYMRNSNQSHSDLLANYTNAKIVIKPPISKDFLGRQCGADVQPAVHSPEQAFYCKNINFSHFSLPYCKGLTCPINKVVQSNWIVMQNNKTV